MSNSGNVAWRYRWSGWELSRIHTDKRGRQSEFLGEGAAKDRETGALLSIDLDILVILCIFKLCQ